MPDLFDGAGLRAVVQAQREQTRWAAAELSRLANRIAESEDRIAATFEVLAEGAQPSRAETLRSKAAHARAFAQHERRERDRWAAFARR
jgi:hypothetical protein